ncbi:MAG: hypothetical protein FWE22_08485 [Firmicutes bacterium]|nr:hypothetical protein [Bacillota bacterium]
MKIKIIKQNKRFLALIVALTVALSCLILFIPTTSRVEARGSGLFIHGVEVPEHQLYIEEYILRIPLHRIHENNSVRIWRSNTSSQNNVLGRNSVVDLMRDGKATHTLKIRITFNDVFDLGERGNFLL